MKDHRAVIGMLAGAAGGAVAIGIMEAFSTRAAIPLMAIPFATSIVLVMGSPEVDAAQPRALVGGHIVATIVGLIVVKIAGPEPVSYTHLRAHETGRNLVCRLLLEKK